MLDDHCGWVRSLAISPGSRWLFSAACNTLRQWDMSRAVPRCVGTVSQHRGDILALVASRDRVYAAGADGAIRWVGGCLGFGWGWAWEWEWWAGRPVSGLWQRLAAVGG